MKDTILVHIKMDKDIHRDLRVMAIREGKTLREFIEMLVTKYRLTVEN